MMQNVKTSRSAYSISSNALAINTQSFIAEHMRRYFLQILVVCCLVVVSQETVVAQSSNQSSDSSGLSPDLILQRLGARMESGMNFEQHLDYIRHFDRVDTDHDGIHTPAEFIENGFYLNPQARRGIFRAADENADGQVTRDEYVLNRIITDEAKSIMLGMDDDQDSAISRTEFLTHTESKFAEPLRTELFEKLDTNGDGYLIIPEFLRIWGQWARKDQPPAKVRLDTQRKVELDLFWQEVSRTVREGDFEGYAATCHNEGVLVSGSSNSSYPLSRALVRWKKGFQDTQSGAMQAFVDFRFSQRMGDATTAHELGMFRYATKKGGENTVAFIHFEALLVKKTNGWKILMEYQKSKANERDWEVIKP
jgi:Ca2+-binding EF-hand superfamily protein